MYADFRNNVSFIWYYEIDKNKNHHTYVGTYRVA